MTVVGIVEHSIAPQTLRAYLASHSELAEFRAQEGLPCGHPIPIYQVAQYVVPLTHCGWTSSTISGHLVGLSSCSQLVAFSDPHGHFRVQKLLKA